MFVQRALVMALPTNCRLQWNEVNDNIMDCFRSLKEHVYFADVTLVSEDGEQVEAPSLSLDVFRAVPAAFDVVVFANLFVFASIRSLRSGAVRSSVAHLNNINETLDTVQHIISACGGF